MDKQKISNIAITLSVCTFCIGMAIGLLISPGTLTDKSPKRCAPPLGASPLRVIDVCGSPKVKHKASGEYWVQEEWDYGSTIVGFRDGEVTYVIAFDGK
jgi:hypothetical protein